MASPSSSLYVLGSLSILDVISSVLNNNSISFVISGAGGVCSPYTKAANSNLFLLSDLYQVYYREWLITRNTSVAILHEVGIA